MDELALRIKGSDPIILPTSIPGGGIETGSKVINLSLELLVIFGIALTLIFIIYSGIQWATSEGDKQKVQNARNRLTYSIVGLLIIVSAFFIISFVVTLVGGKPESIFSLPVSSCTQSDCGGRGCDLDEYCFRPENSDTPGDCACLKNYRCTDLNCGGQPCPADKICRIGVESCYCDTRNPADYHCVQSDCGPTAKPCNTYEHCVSGFGVDDSQCGCVNNLSSCTQTDCNGKKCNPDTQNCLMLSANKSDCDCFNKDLHGNGD